MIELFRRLLSSSTTIEVCETCAQACTAQCRADALLDKARTQALRLPSRF